MSNKLSWRDALKQFNDDRIKEGGKYTIPKKGTPEYASVRKLMGDDIDAVPLQPNKTITGQEPTNLVSGQNAPGKSTGKPRPPSKSRTPKEKQEAPLPTKEKPLWNDDPKPVEKTTKLKPPKKNIKQEYVMNDKKELVLVSETQIPPDGPETIKENIKKQKSNKKSVATQTEPASPKDDDFVVEMK